MSQEGRNGWRMAGKIAVAVFVPILIQTAILFFTFGKVLQQVDHNTEAIASVAELVSANRDDINDLQRREAFRRGTERGPMGDSP